MCISKGRNSTGGGILRHDLEKRQFKNKTVYFPFNIEFKLFEQDLIRGRRDFIAARQREREFGRDYYYSGCVPGFEEDYFLHTTMRSKLGVARRFIVL